MEAGSCLSTGCGAKLLSGQKAEEEVKQVEQRNEFHSCGFFHDKQIMCVYIDINSEHKMFPVQLGPECVNLRPAFMQQLLDSHTCLFCLFQGFVVSRYKCVIKLPSSNHVHPSD